MKIAVHYNDEVFFGTTPSPEDGSFDDVVNKVYENIDDIGKLLIKSDNSYIIFPEYVIKRAMIELFPDTEDDD